MSAHYQPPSKYSCLAIDSLVFFNVYTIILLSSRARSLPFLPPRCFISGFSLWRLAVSNAGFQIQSG
jgi:hypothetical protein